MQLGLVSGGGWGRRVRWGQMAEGLKGSGSWCCAGVCYTLATGWRCFHLPVCASAHFNNDLGRWTWTYVNFWFQHQHIKSMPAVTSVFMRRCWTNWKSKTFSGPSLKSGETGTFRESPWDLLTWSWSCRSHMSAGAHEWDLDGFLEDNCEGLLGLQSQRNPTYSWVSPPVAPLGITKKGWQRSSCGSGRDREGVAIMTDAQSTVHEESVLQGRYLTRASLGVGKGILPLQLLLAFLFYLKREKVLDKHL